MKEIVLPIAKEEFVKMRKHDRVIMIYEILHDCKVICEGTGRIVTVAKDGRIEKILYKEMLQDYYRGIAYHD